jgi:tetratricopeptide (TPR) repeat protein
MKPESVAYTIAGMAFGIILGWVIGTQQVASGGGVSPPAPVAAAPAAAPTQRAMPPLDESRLRTLTGQFDRDPRRAETAVEIANVYFDAERWDDAIVWYERALEIDPANADASTDLGVSYFYTSRTDRALAQFEHSLQMDPTHTKAMLNKGIVLAFGREDLRGATEEWKRVVSLAADSPEGEAARRLLEGVAAAHGGDVGLVPAAP